MRYRRSRSGVWLPDSAGGTLSEPLPECMDWFPIEAFRCDLVGAAVLFAGAVLPGYQLFTSSGPFTVPNGVYSARLLVVDGGGGSVRYGSGAGSGRVQTATVALTPGDVHTVTVGAPGLGEGSGAVFGNNGSPSSFGSLLVGVGGERGRYNGENASNTGGSGGSGGGGGGTGSTGGNGGSAGDAGQSATGGAYAGAGGTGGHFASDLATLFKLNSFTAGPGGTGSSSSGVGMGGGAGGVLINGAAAAAPGVTTASTGTGYGAGGGGNEADATYGAGVQGFVYVEWG